MFGLYKNLLPLAPAVDGPGHRVPQRLAGTGATESHTSRELKPGHLYAIFVGATGVRVKFSGSRQTGSSSVSPTRDIVYGPWTQVPFVPESGISTFVSAEAADGSSAYECFVVSLQG